MSLGKYLSHQESKIKQKKNKKESFIDLQGSKPFHNYVRRGILLSDIKCHFKEKKGS